MKYISLILSVLVLSACSMEQKNSESNPAVTHNLTEVLSVDNSREENGLPVVSFVSDVTTDDRGNIYFVDPRLQNIHSIDETGAYRWSAGGRGAGPGQFNMITAIYAYDQHLYLYDQPASKIAILDTNGERTDEFSYGEAAYRINDIRKHEGGFIVSGWNEEDESLAGLYSENMKDRSQSIVSASNHYLTEHPHLEKEVFRNHPGWAISSGAGNILFAPPAYGGELFLYSKQDDGSWTVERAIAGYKSIEDPLLIHISREGDHERSHLSGFNPDGGYFHAEFRSWSHGLYELEGNRIAHISMKQSGEDGWQVIIEYFDAETLELVHHTVSENLVQDRTMPLWIDKTGKIYFTENSDTPLRVFEISEGE